VFQTRQSRSSFCSNVQNGGIPIFSASGIRSTVAATRFRLVYVQFLLTSAVNYYLHCLNVEVLPLQAESRVFAQLRLYHGVSVMFILSRIYRLKDNYFFFSLLIN
jgi:hypothetical protein